MFNQWAIRRMGQKVRDKITGFVGVITGKTDYITGCTQFLVQPLCSGDGAFIDGQWFDETRLEVVETKPAPENTSPNNDPC